MEENKMADRVEDDEVPALVVEAAPRFPLTEAIREIPLAVFRILRSHERAVRPAADVVIADGVIRRQLD